MGAIARWVATGASLTMLACVGPFSERVERQYVDVATARAADAVGELRWIPAILPNDAVQIREVHDIDTNETWGCFHTGQPEAVRAVLIGRSAIKSQAAIGAAPKELFRDFSWWPEAMQSGAAEAWQYQEDPVYAGATPYAVRVGLDVASGTVCFHRTM